MSESYPLLAFVSMDWVQNRLQLRAEPTVLMIASGGSLVWDHVGQMSKSDLNAAERVLARMSDRPGSR